MKKQKGRLTAVFLLLAVGAAVSFVLFSAGLLWFAVLMLRACSAARAK